MRGAHKILGAFTVFALITLLATTSTGKVFGQIGSSGISISTPIKSESVQDGDVICSSGEGYVLCAKAHDPAIYGVVTENPAASFESEGDEDVRLVMTTGNARVRVTNSNGNIKEGDLITSSDTPGVAQLADRNGFVLGTALESFESDNVGEEGRVLISVDVHVATTLAAGGANLLELLREGFSAPILGPLGSLRYLLAFAIALVTFTIGFVYFGRIVMAGIEAMGRNPLARKMIQFNIFLNTMIMLVIIIVGLAIAYLILIL